MRENPLWTWPLLSGTMVYLALLTTTFLIFTTCPGGTLAADNSTFNYSEFQNICEFTSNMNSTLKGLLTDPVISDPIHINEYSECQWTLAFSTSRNPFQVYTTYFNERDPEDVQEQLTRPDTLRYLDPVRPLGSQTDVYQTFPYFILVRGTCELGPFSDQFYQAIIQQGVRPMITTMYSPPTSRSVHADVLQVNFRPALINLIPDVDHKIVEKNTNPACENTQNRATGVGGPEKTQDLSQDRTRERICYPAFAVPMVMLYIPIFQVRIQGVGPFAGLQRSVFMSPFHSRKVEGLGQVEIATEFKCVHTEKTTGEEKNKTFTTTSVMPKYFFPKERYGISDDDALAEDCSPTPTMPPPPPRTPQCRILHTLYDSDPHNDSFPDEASKPFFPLDSDDFFSPQFTFGTAPVIALAGFYRPDLVIYSDPDMNSIHLFNFKLDGGNNATAFDDQLECIDKVLGRSVSDGGDGVLYPKPMYALVEPDTYRSHYYRYRYEKQNYSLPATKAIFEIIALEDRLLLVTTVSLTTNNYRITAKSGLVVLYGDSNVTIDKDRVLRAFEDDKRRYCYKFVRILRTALMAYDPIVAVTFDYTQGTARIDQEVHYGIFKAGGDGLEWIRIGKDEYADRDVTPPESGTAVGVESKQEDLSEAIKICLEVKQNHIDPSFSGSTSRSTDFFWKEAGETADRDDCNILDGTPIPTRPDVVQLFVFMSFTFYKNASCELPEHTNATDCSEINEYECHTNDDAFFTDNCRFGQQKIRLYVVAEHTVKKVILEGSSWKISGIIPEVPCQGRHREGVRNILPFGKSYFGLTDERRSCYEEFYDRYSDFLYLNGITYTRQIANHMYVYGNKLLHSSDAGQSFIQSRFFPHSDNSIDVIGNSRKDFFVSQEFGNRHRIKVMAFGSNSQFAFLTSKRELWVGTTGHPELIRLRPSDGYSSIQMSLYAEDGIHQGIPISVLFDSFNKVFELVAVKDPNTSEIVRVVRRRISFDLIARNSHFVKRLKALTAIAASNVTATEDAEVHYNVRDVSLHCNFNRFKTKQNYTKTLRRLQSFFIGAPTQHLNLGNSDIQPTLMAFQAATYRLIYESYLRKQDDFYSRVEKDPFEKWKQSKAAAAFIGYVKYYKETSQQYGIVVDPRSSSRDKDINDRTAAVAIKSYYFDYNQVTELEMSFVVKSTYLIAKTDFKTQRLDNIQLNVDNTNGNLLRVDVIRSALPRSASVKFNIFMSLKKNNELRQSESGRGLVPIPLSFHFLGAFGTCFDYAHYGTIGESLSVSVLAGCPPATDILFDWKNTLESLKFRHKDMKYGDETYCHDRFFVCFYAREQVVFFFDRFDQSKQKFLPFSGKYKFRVIGGGESLQSMQSYTLEQQEAFNIPGQSDVSLIWTIAPKEEDEGEDVLDFKVDKDPRTQENILQSGVSRIKWTCNTLSPCARVRPKLSGRTIFFFKINITNRGVDPDTLCVNERILTIMVYGFPPSPETLLLATLVSSVTILLTLYLMYYCCRGNRRVWRSQKLKMWGWVQIVTDTFPKPLKNRADLDEKEQLRKDSILLSLQGHLRVPSLLHKPRRQRLASQGTSISGKSSAGSDASLESQISSEILPQVHPRKAAATWTEMVYEQIISRRLLAIVERNKRMRDAIIRKVQMKATAEEEEEGTERQNATDEEKGAASGTEAKK